MRKGIVTHIDILSGKGIIEDENEQDINFHLNLTHRYLQAGHPVEFQITLSPNGLLATDVAAIGHQYAPTVKADKIVS